MSFALKWIGFFLCVLVLVQATGDIWVFLAVLFLGPIVCPFGWLCWYGQPGPRSSELRRRPR